MKLIIKNGTIINPVHHQHEKGDVVIEDGKIVSLGGIADVPGAEVYDAEGFFVTPGLIDMHVHLREPGSKRRYPYRNTSSRRRWDYSCGDNGKYKTGY